VAPVVERRVAAGVLVIGTGAAGLRAAIELAERGVQVLCVGQPRGTERCSSTGLSTQKDPTSALRVVNNPDTMLASGGINAALGTVDPEDSWEQHAADTLREGYWLGDPRSVELLCREAPGAIEDLVRWGAQFAREADWRLSQRFFGAHRYRRTCFAGDYTGREIQRTLVRRAEEVGVSIRDDVYVTRLLVHDGCGFGCYAFGVDDGSRWVFLADTVILAAGGHTRIWRRSSSRRDENTGDAMRLAAEVGCRLRDMELVQFQPHGDSLPGGIGRNARDRGGPR
jgi:succinate dehydrogenase / fumarate reductase, flavoprotein subunit